MASPAADTLEDAASPSQGTYSVQVGLFPAEKSFMTRSVYYEPLRRIYHTMQCVGNKGYLYGGLFDAKLPSGVSLKQLASTVHIFDPLTELWTSKLVGGESIPFGNVNAASTVLDGSLYSVGGQDVYNCVTNEVHQLDTKSLKWYKLTPQNPEDGPIAKLGCGMVTFLHYLAVFGGYGPQMN